MLYKEASTLVEDNFNDGYFKLHNHIYTHGHSVSSRNGATREILNFKTVLTKPLNRCIAGWGRNINIFFLMAESFWIFKGRRDVEFLDIFNGQMKHYSDNGKFFHAPYGWRLRKYGIDSMNEIDSSNLHATQSARDQLLEGLEMLHKNPEDRRVVLQIWNSEFDLNKKSSDLPCNCILMFKIRNNQLHQTTANRSNDLDWGLTTNVYQFSFIGEVMSQLLGLEYGTQVHNSQSLHLYMQAEMTTYLESSFITTIDFDNNNLFKLYQNFRSLPITFKFLEEELSLLKKLYWVDFYLHGIILKLLSLHKGTLDNKEQESFNTELKEFSYGLYVQYRLLTIFVNYKKHKHHRSAVNELLQLHQDNGLAGYDIFLLAMNFFVRRILDKDKEEGEELIDFIKERIPSWKYIQIGKL